MNHVAAQSEPLVAKDLMRRLEKLEARVAIASISLRAVVPLEDALPVTQQCFLFACADLQLLEKLVEVSKEASSTNVLINLTDEEVAASGYSAKREAAFAKTGMETTCRQLGVTEEVMKYVALKNLQATLNLIETILVRAEGNVRAVCG